MRGDAADPVSLNRYAYVRNDPLNFIDPSGMSLRSLLNRGKNAITGVGKSVISKFAQTAANFVKKVASPVQNSINSQKKTADSVVSVSNHKTGNSGIKSKFNSIINSQKGKTPVLEDNSSDYGKVKQLNANYRRNASPVKPSVDSTTVKAKFCSKRLNTKKNFFSRLFSWPVDAFKDSARNGDQDDFLRITLGAERDKDNPDLYHIKQNYWQSIPIVGYNDLYDVGFKVGVGATGGSANRKKFSFKTDDGTTYMLWLWKGDYINLGAGAEAGIYKKSIIPGHYLTSTENSMKMSMHLTDHNTGETIADYSPEEYQWWITAFNPQHQNVQSSDLDVTFTFDFSNLDESMWEAFVSEYSNNKAFKFEGNHLVSFAWEG